MRLSQNNVQEAQEKCLDSRHGKFSGVRRTFCTLIVWKFFVTQKMSIFLEPLGEPRVRPVFISERLAVKSLKKIQKCFCVMLEYLVGVE